MKLSKFEENPKTPTYQTLILKSERITVEGYKWVEQTVMQDDYVDQSRVNGPSNCNWKMYCRLKDWTVAIGPHNRLFWTWTWDSGTETWKQTNKNLPNLPAFRFRKWSTNNQVLIDYEERFSEYVSQCSDDLMIKIVFLASLVYLNVLQEYHTQPFVTSERKSDLSTQLNLTERQIKIWFQNRWEFHE